MRTIALVVIIALLAVHQIAAAPAPAAPPHHILLGPYTGELNKEQAAQYRAFDPIPYQDLAALRAAMDALPRPKQVPPFYVLDGKHYTSIGALKAAVAKLPTGSAVYLRGGCQPDSAIHLPPESISLVEFQSYCRRHNVIFTWKFGVAT